MRSVMVCGIDVAIVEATPDQVPALREPDGTLLFGFFDEESATIYVRKGQSRTLRRETINHEIVHAWFAYSGAREYLAGVTKGKLDHEERLVRILSPHAATIRWSR